MHAAVIREFGGPEVLRYEEVETPRSGPGEVLVKLVAVSISRGLDLGVRAGKSPWPIQFPHVLGSDPSGVVEAIGPDVERIQVGARVAVRSDVVCGECDNCHAGRSSRVTQHIGVEVWGDYADYVLVKERQAFLIPDGLDHAAASYASRHYGMALGQIRAGALGAGDTALVMGAAGALGLMLIQLLASEGIEVIAAAGEQSRRICHGFWSPKRCELPRPKS